MFCKSSFRTNSFSLCGAAIEENKALIDGETVTHISDYVVKVKGIRDVLARDHMKVAFFGR